MRAMLAGLFALAVLTGCGAASPDCTITTTFNVTPVTASADHSAAAPGNQVHFNSAVTVKAASASCAVPLVIPATFPTWTNPDPLDISISSAADSTNGTAICHNATSAPVTLTATEGVGPTAQTSSVQLTCQ